VADAQPSWSVTARDALPPISGHETRYLTIKLSGQARCPCRGQTRPTTAHGQLQRAVRLHIPELLRRYTAEWSLDP
jgi:hypothetical protein